MSSAKLLYILLVPEMKKRLYNAKCHAISRLGSCNSLPTIIFSDEQTFLIPSRLHRRDDLGESLNSTIYPKWNWRLINSAKEVHDYISQNMNNCHTSLFFLICTKWIKWSFTKNDKEDFFFFSDIVVLSNNFHLVDWVYKIWEILRC